MKNDGHRAYFFFSSPDVLEVSRSLDDSVSTVDDLLRSAARGRMTTDIAELTDDLLPWQLRNRLTDDTLGLSDDLTRWTRLFRLLSDALPLVDSILAGAGPQTYVRALDDDTSLSDNLTRALEKLRTADDVLTPTDDLVRAAGFVRLLTDVLPLVDDIATAVAGVLFRALTDGVELSDVLDRTTELVRLESDATGLTDSLLSQVVITKNVLDSIATSDDVTIAVVRHRLLSEWADLTDDLTSEAAGVIQQTLTDSLSLGEDVVRLAVLARLLDDAVSPADFLGEIPATQQAVGKIVLAVEGLVVRLRVAKEVDIDVDS